MKRWVSMLTVLALLVSALSTGLVAAAEEMDISLTYEVNEDNTATLTYMELSDVEPNMAYRLDVEIPDDISIYNNSFNMKWNSSNATSFAIFYMNSSTNIRLRIE